MIIGLIILGIAAVLIFFGAAERYFETLGLTSWLSFIIILAFVLGAVVPDISVSGVIVSLGGFIVPLVTVVVLAAISVKRNNLFRALISAVLAAAITVGVRVLFKPEINSEAIMPSSLIIGFVCGAVAFIFSGNRIGMLITAIGGIVIGDIISASLSYSANPQTNLVFGGNAVFDALAVSCAFGLILFEAVNAVRNVRLSASSKAVLNTEAAEDVILPDEEKEKSTNAKTAEEKKKYLDYLDE